MSRRPWHATPLTLGNRLDGRGQIELSPDDRRTHTYIAGTTGAGKTKLIEHMVRQDISRWRKHRCGMLLIDPHGSLYRDVMRAVAARGATGLPIIPIDLTDDQYVISYNAMRKQKKAQQSAIVAAFVRATAYVWGQMGTDQTPRFERWAKGIFNALYELDLTLADAASLISLDDPSFRQRVMPHLTGKAAEHWRWACGLPKHRFEEQIESSFSRIQRFEECERLKLMFGAHGQSFDFTQAIEEGWIVLVNGSTEGAWGYEEDVDTLITLMLSDLWTAGSVRGKGNDKRPFRVIIDEFQRFITPSIAGNLAEARGYGLHLTLATQFPTQLLSKGQIGQDIYRNVMGNANSKVVFSVAEPESLKVLAEWLFLGSIDPDQIKHEIYASRPVDYEVIKLNSSGVTETDSGGGGDTVSYDAEGNEVGSTSSSRDNVGTSTTYGESETLAPVYAKELASRQYRSVEEQFFLAMQKIVRQDQRYAYVRTASMKTPVAICTPEVKPGRARDKFVQDYTQRLLEKLPFALRTEAARKQLAERRAVISGQKFGTIDEPTTAKRIIR